MRITYKKKTTIRPLNIRKRNTDIIQKPLRLNKINNSTKNGIMMISFGFDYDNIAPYCAKSIRRFTDLPILVHTNIPDFVRNELWDTIDGVEFVLHDLNDDENRNIKTQLSKYTKFNKTLYIDVDSEVLSSEFLKPFKDLSMYDIIVPKWKKLTTTELSLMTSKDKKYDGFYNILINNNLNTYDFVGGGVCYFRKKPIVDEFFQQFYKNWVIYGKQQDMPPLNQTIINFNNQLKIKLLDIKMYNGTKSTVILSNHNTLKSVNNFENFTRTRFNSETNAFDYCDQGSSTFYSKKKICFIYDVFGWAFYNKSYNIKKYLYKQYEIDIVKYNKVIDKKYDLYICFNTKVTMSSVDKDKIMIGVSSKKDHNQIDEALSYKISHSNNKETFNLLKNEHKYLLYNGVNINFYNFEKRTLGRNNNVRIGGVGSFKWAEYKGKFRIQDMCNRDNRLINNSLFTNIKTGVLTQKEMKNIYSNIDIFIVSSVDENTPNPLLEAMSIGIPVIANRTGMVDELIIHGENGFIVENYDDIDMYLRYIDILINDDKLYETFSINGRRSVENFSWEEMSKKYKEMIDDGINICV